MLDRHALLAQLHRQRRDHERRVEPAGLEVSTTVGKSVKRCDSKRVRVAGLRRVVGDRAGQVAGDGQEADRQRLARLRLSLALVAALGCQGRKRSSPSRATNAMAPAPQLISGDDSVLIPSSPRPRSLSAATPFASSLSDSSPSSARMRRTAATTCGCVRSRGRGTSSTISSRIARRPLRQDEDAVGELRRLLDVVRHEHDRARLLAQHAARAPVASAGASGSRATRTARPSAGVGVSPASARASSTRCRMPPESWCG